MTVGVVGLGISGLRAATLLEAAGVEVQLFEARSRIGGRVHTIDEGGGAVYEAGGEWVDADHARTLELLRSHGVEPLNRSEWPRKLLYRGKEISEALLWSDALEDDLRVEAAARELCADLGEPAWRNWSKTELDQTTLARFLEEQCQSERGLWYVTANCRSDEGDDPERIGLLGWLTGYLHYLEREGDIMSAYRVPGGFSSICSKMRSELRGEVQLGKELKRVQQGSNGITLYFDKGEAKVDRLLLTLPPAAIERIVFEPALPVETRCAIEACKMSRAVKIAWEFKSAWWEEMEWGGSMLCDTPIQQTWASFGDAPVLCAYICGERGAEWSKLGDPVNAGIYELAKLFPQAAQQFKRGWFHNWVCDPYSQGAFSHLAPEYVLGHMEHIAAPTGRIHFAGEHTATWTGFVEGALESAERVAQEILGGRSNPLLDSGNG